MPYCHSLASLSVVDSIYRGDSFEEDITQFFIPSQCTAIFEHLRSLHIVSTKSAEQWLEWLGPHSSNLQTFTLETDVSLPPDVLPLISPTIQSLDVRFMTTKRTQLEEITDWTKCLLEVASSRHFSELKSFKLFLSRDCLNYFSRRGYSGKVPEAMRKFRKELTVVYKGEEVECNLDLPFSNVW